MGLFRWLRQILGRRSTTGLAEEQDGLRDTIVGVISHLNRKEIAHALVGGVAVSAHGHVRATRDVDLLIDGDAEAAVHEIMTELGFEVLQRNDNVSNYLLQHARVDFIHARRQYSRAMLDRATPISFGGLATKVVTTEDLIGLKVQALSNDPSWAQDRADIEILLRGREKLDMALIREYFSIFGREDELDGFLKANPRDG